MEENTETVRDISGRRYGFCSVVALFFVCSMAGWLWEVFHALWESGELVNRGFLHGPWLPIYGSGACLILLLLGRFRARPALVFFLSMALCGVLEYATGLCLERLHDGQRWWDYSERFLNFQGRVCAEGLLLFAVSGCVVVYWLAPRLDDLLHRATKQVLAGVCAVLLVLFAADVVWSLAEPNAGQGITSGVAAETAPSGFETVI